MSRPDRQDDRTVADRAKRRYGLLLRLVPADFRARHAAAMEDAFAALHARARGAGIRAVLMLWLRESWDLALTGLSLRLRERRQLTLDVQHRARSRSARSLSVLGTLRDDWRFAVRATTRHRGFFFLAAITLALGIGATTAMYSALKAVVLEPFPFPGAERTVLLQRTMGTSGRAFFGLEMEDIALLRDQRDVFERIVGMSSGTATLTSFGEPQRVLTLKMTADLPAFIGVQPVVGRTFTHEELAGDGQRVVLISHAMWRRRFAGRRDVLGEPLRIDGQSSIIIGVMPRDAVRPQSDPRPVDLWLPLPDRDPLRTSIARLVEGVTLETAAARVDAVVRRSPSETFGGTAQPLVRAVPLHDYLRVLMVAVTLLLLVACVNVSNLLLQRAAVRSRETAVRSALGASRARLMRQFVLESLILAIVGGVLGAGLSYGGVRVLTAFRPEQLDALQKVRIDGGVLLFSVIISVGAGLLFGILPAVRGSRTAATAALGRFGTDGDSRSSRFRWGLVAAEIGLSFALLIGATLTIKSLRALASRDPGYLADGLVSIDVRLPAWRYPESAARAAAFDQMIDDVRKLPAVRAVSLADGVPPRLGSARLGHLHVEGKTPETELAIFESFAVDSSFVETLGLVVVSGRRFTGADATSALHPVILAESGARRLFPGEPAVGRRFRLEGDDDFTVVGVVRDIRTSGLTDDGSTPLAYWPLQHVRERMTIIARANREDAQLMLDLRQTVRRTEPDAIIEVVTAREMLGATLAQERFTTSLLSAFAALALLLAAVGLYGVLSQVVVSRTREIGVRIALGADAGRIWRLVLRTGMLATIVGLVLGAGLSALGLRALRGQVFGLTEAQPTSYIAAAGVLLIVSLAAMLVPASRAARMDPMRAIRVE
jgi:putative ABC transport system permease protein